MSVVTTLKCTKHSVPFSTSIHSVRSRISNQAHSKAIPGREQGLSNAQPQCGTRIAGYASWAEPGYLDMLQVRTVLVTFLPRVHLVTVRHHDFQCRFRLPGRGHGGVAHQITPDREKTFQLSPGTTDTPAHRQSTSGGKGNSILRSKAHSSRCRQVGLTSSSRNGRRNMGRIDICKIHTLLTLTALSIHSCSELVPMLYFHQMS